MFGFILENRRKNYTARLRAVLTSAHTTLSICQFIKAKIGGTNKNYSHTSVYTLINQLILFKTGISHQYQLLPLFGNVGFAIPVSASIGLPECQINDGILMLRSASLFAKPDTGHLRKSVLNELSFSRNRHVYNRRHVTHSQSNAMPALFGFKRPFCSSILLILYQFFGPSGRSTFRFKGR